MPYEPQHKVAEMMKLFGQDVRIVPRMIEDPKERLCAANLVIEEAVEFVRALGFDPIVDEDGEVALREEPSYTPDIVQAADAIGDILVVTYGAANRLGVNGPAVFNEVHRSNMTKVWPDGTVHKRESDGKVIKPNTYTPPDIEEVLKSSKYSSVIDLIHRTYPELRSASARGQNLWSALATEAFGKAYQFTYTLAEKSKEVGPVGIFAKVGLARQAAKLIVFSHGHKLGPKKLAKLLFTTEPIADEFLSMFEARFPKLTPARPASEEDDPPARVTALEPEKAPETTQPKSISAEPEETEESAGTEEEAA